MSHNHFDDYQQSTGGPGVGESGGTYTLHEAALTITDSNEAAVLALSDGRVVTAVVQTAAKAQQLASNRLARLPSDLLADQAKPIAQTVADALIAAGYGT
jgi:hypothetical protein